MPENLDLVLRGGAATTFLLLAVILLRDGENRVLARLGALFAISTGWWALNFQPFAAWTYQWAFPLLVVTYGKAAAFWLFTRALFEDDFKLKPLDWGVWSAMAAGGGVWIVCARAGLPSDWVRIPHQLAQVALALSAAWIAWKGRGGDLVESRRRSRMVFVVLSALMMIGVTGSYLAFGRPPSILRDLNVVRIFLTAIGMALLVAGLRSHDMFARAAAPMSVGAKSRPSGSDPTEARLLGRLDRVMEEERAYRQDGLTIGTLAVRIGAPEHVLRRLINQRMGHRNFNAYLNGWRLAEARAALLDPAQAEVPISTIALDAGFRSLGPFNRAFKAVEGVTPSTFRTIASQEATAARLDAQSPNLKIV